MARPERRVVLAGVRPARVSAGAPGSRLRLETKGFGRGQSSCRSTPFELAHREADTGEDPRIDRPRGWALDRRRGRTDLADGRASLRVQQRVYITAPVFCCCVSGFEAARQTCWAENEYKIGTFVVDNKYRFVVIPVMWRRN